MTDTDQPALDRLLEYIDGERDDRCRSIVGEAEKEALAVLRTARTRARNIVHRAVGAERLRREKEQRKMQAAVQARLRRAWFRLIRRELDQAWPTLQQAVVAHWRASPQNRCEWLHLTLEMAAHALGPGLWHLEHPADWQMEEGESVFKLFTGQHENLQVESRPREHPAGFRVACGDVSVSTTVDGLFARKSRVEGLWLALLQKNGVLAIPATGDGGDD